MIEDYIKRFSSFLPDKIAISIKDSSVTYSELYDFIVQYATVLSVVYGVTEKSRVVLRAERSLNFIFSYFALHKLNAIVLPIDEHIVDSTLEFIKKEVNPIHVIGNDCGDTLSYNELFLETQKEHSVIEFPSISVDDIADIMFTSGTTGTPKGVILTHDNIETSAINIANYIGNTEEDIEVLALPLCHSFGLGRIRSTMVRGGSVFIHDGFSNVKSLFKLIESTQATGFSMVPAGWNLIRKLSGTRISRFSNQLKYIEMGSSYLSSEDKKQLADLFPHTRVCMHYGLTEASRSCFMEFHSDVLESVGIPLNGVDVRIYSDGILTKDDGLEGEICISGKHVTKGYWNNANNQTEYFFNGYIRTGDIGCFSEGYLYITGRLKDLINSGGKKISAKEIEELTDSYPHILESACIGAKDDMLGEVPKLYIVTEDDVDINNLSQFLKSSLEDYKIPREIVIVDTLPKTQNGKIQKFKLQ